MASPSTGVLVKSNGVVVSGAWDPNAVHGPRRTGWHTAINLSVSSAERTWWGRALPGPRPVSRSYDWPEPSARRQFGVGAKVGGPSQRAQLSGLIRRRLANVVPGRWCFGRHRATPGDGLVLIWEQEAAGSNPAIPDQLVSCSESSVCRHTGCVRQFRS